MKKSLPVAAVLLVAAVALYFLLHQPEKPQPVTGESPAKIPPAAGPAENRPAPPSVSEAPSAPPVPVGSEAPSSNLAARAGVVTPPSTIVPDLSPLMVVANVSHAIHDYNAVFGGNPIGTNPEITSALNGNNPKHLNFIKPELGMSINGQGELVDPWGTPLFFHQLSSHDTEVRSAGKDKILWTADDVVSR